MIQHHGSERLKLITLIRTSFAIGRKQRKVFILLRACLCQADVMHVIIAKQLCTLSRPRLSALRERFRHVYNLASRRRTWRLLNGRAGPPNNDPKLFRFHNRLLFLGISDADGSVVICRVTTQSSRGTLFLALLTGQISRILQTRRCWGSLIHRWCKRLYM